MTLLLETRNVSKSYGAFLALEQVNMAVHQGERVSVVGPNGAGKTTLVNLLTGLLEPSSGEVLFMGKNIAGAFQRGANDLGHVDELDVQLDGACFEAGHIEQVGDEPGKPFGLLLCRPEQLCRLHASLLKERLGFTRRWADRRVQLAAIGVR